MLQKIIGDVHMCGNCSIHCIYCYIQVSWAAYDYFIFGYNMDDEVNMNKKQSDKQTAGLLCPMYKNW